MASGIVASVARVGMARRREERRWALWGAGVGTGLWGVGLGGTGAEGGGADQALGWRGGAGVMGRGKARADWRGGLGWATVVGIVTAAAAALGFVTA